MNLISTIVIATLAILVTGCSTPKYNYIPMTTEFSSPSLNTLTTARLGDRLLDQGVSSKREALLIEEDASILTYNIKIGKLIKIGEDNKYKYYGNDLLTPPIITQGIIIKTPLTQATIKQDKVTNEICIMSVIEIDGCGSVKTRTINEDVVSKSSFRQTLIYTGKIDNRLRMTYRESSGDYARPAYTTDVEYDLSQDNEIGYGGALLEIIDASNTKITYKVLNNFNTP